MSPGIKNLLIALGLFILSIGATAALYALKSHHDRPAFANVTTLALININIILLGLLLLVIGRNLVKFYFERKASPYGAGFRTKLVASFIGLAIVPAGILFFVAIELLAGGVKYWFGPRVESTVRDSIQLVESYREDRLQSASRYAGNIAGEASGLGQPSSEGTLQPLLKRGLELYGLDTISVYDEFGGLVAEAGANGDGPPAEAISRFAADVAVGAPGSKAVSIDGTELYLGAAVYQVPPEEGAGPKAVPAAPPRYVVVAAFLPSAEVAGAVGTITTFYKEYWNLRMFKNPLRESYTLSFILFTMLIVFAALWIGLYLSKNITVPITTLADATQRISAGDYDFDIDVKAGDEIGALVDSFRRMTRELKQSQERLTEANLSLKESNELLEQRKKFIETVLENVNAGVVTIDRAGRFATANRATERITGLDAKSLIGRGYQEVFEVYELDELREQVGRLDPDSHAGIEKEIKLKINRRTLELRLFLCPLHDAAGGYLGILVVFDDLTNLIKAQRAAAWREVARRIAHEVKNPLTPIQLSAQRLRKRCLDVEGDCGGVIDECTRTIVAQVDTMRVLVDEFSEFARMPEPRPVPLSIGGVIDEVVSLYVSAHRDVTAEVSVEGGMPDVRADKDQIKRALVNLYENAVKAMDGKGRVWITARTDAERGVAVLEFADEGHGILPDDREKLFMPYFSKDKSGTGLGLAIVQRIISDHGGQIRVEGNTPKGARFIIELPLSGNRGE